jgi:hypothetical protein
MHRVRCQAGPGQALVTVRLLSGQSATERSGQGRSGGEIAAGQGPQAVLRLAAFPGACAGRPFVGDTGLWYQVSAGGVIGVDHLCEVTAFHLPGGEPGSSRRHARRR